MPDFEPTLWRISAFERLKEQRARFQTPGQPGPTLLATTLQAELGELDRSGRGSELLEVLATCQRLREAALIHLDAGGFVWPVTVFPAQDLYHSPRSLERAPSAMFAAFRVLSVEPPGVRAPGHWMHERVGSEADYHPLLQVLWRVAFDGARGLLLPSVAGRAAYRVVRPRTGFAVAGALGSAIERLHRESAALRHIESWPGMNLDRARRLINALYLTSNLIVSRTHPRARPEPDAPARPHR